MRKRIKRGGEAEAQAKQVRRKKRFWCMTDNDCIDLMGKKKKGGLAVHEMKGGVRWLWSIPLSL